MKLRPVPMLDDLYEKAKARAKSLGLSSFAAYVRSLIIKDLG